MRKKSVVGGGAAGGGGCGAGAEEEADGEEQLQQIALDDGDGDSDGDGDGDGEDCAIESEALLETGSTASNCGSNCERGTRRTASDFGSPPVARAPTSANPASPFSSETGADE